ncbi:MAG: class I SAM-dependent methyltransferase [Methylocystis sp.]|uniref:class I SAM-dependent methyltransferase n=1 Tax=Methylocystis sp. TaxID=1911079 RepID=UPI003DA1F9D9
MSKDEAEGERQYRSRVNLIKAQGREQLGLATSWAWHDDPRHLVFTLARYKFVAKMLAGSKRVLEVGCGDGFPTRLVAQAVESVVGIDFDSEFIGDANMRFSKRWPIEFRTHNILRGPVAEIFDAAYSLDVIEHIPLDLEDVFLSNITQSLSRHGVLIIGSPSLESQNFASPQSKEGHVNCKTADELHVALGRHFENVFVFSMNDEVVHTGYSKMAHYLMALCCSPKQTRA